MIVYVFLMKRPQDKQAWPVVYQNKEFAETAYGRCSPVVEIDVVETKEES